MSESFIKDIAELKTDIKYISKTLAKVELVLEKQLATEERIAVANKRILKNEEKIEEIDNKFALSIKSHDEKFNSIENFKAKILWGSVVISTIFAFFINKFF